MPPMRIQVVRDERRSLTDGELEFLLRLGPLAVRWVARHAPGPEPMSFVDRQVAGPVAFWEHEHSMRAHEGGTELLDRITLSYRPGLRHGWTRLVFSRLALRALFAYRHWRTRRAVR
jgi:ligand-binding SRPBCC domain-containing protein